MLTNRVTAITRLTAQSTEEEIAAVINLVKQKPAYRRRLLPYLPQQHPVYTGRGTSEVKRIRGYLLACFLHTGLPARALPFVLEVLETESHAYLLAGAARALRGLPAPQPQLAPYMLKAAYALRFTNDVVDFTTWYQAYLPLQQTTALHEVLQTFRWMGSAALSVREDLSQLSKDVLVDAPLATMMQQTITGIEKSQQVYRNTCCGQVPVTRPLLSFGNRKKRAARLAAITLSDQEEKEILFTDFFSGKPTVVTFFYTRCDNPEKCSLTITRLGQLQKALQQAGMAGQVNIAAISYDAGYDTALRMKVYCHERGFITDEYNRAFRVTAGMPVLQQYFNAGVNYVGSIVNHHAVELYVLDADGAIAAGVRQQQWQPQQVITLLQQVQTRKQGYAAKGKALLAPLLSFFIVFFPKCPLCMAAYLSVLGITNMHLLQWSMRLQPVLVALLAVNLLVLYRGVKTRNGWLPFYISLAGFTGIVVLVLGLKMAAAAYPSIALLLAGALLNSLPHAVFIKLKRILHY
ncbi:protein SCO1/2 [Filimonas zeae]|uniref:Thioredoxin domain-containing protein n=1 Tax=Filimonas zeae TaxID=1737353 RepID=A0A917MX42_9BACT|nr:SCO family protein [Filimonas zeae]MDR6340391.1 protein SCO1/2 [Filimonas zeae]GGH72525.1 hypothetical protein GCM10011379_33040 [Filimonas zeae]